MIQCKCIFEPATQNDGVRILIARFVTKAVRENEDVSWDFHIPLVAPSQDTLNLFKNQDIKFPIFIKRYLDELREVGPVVMLKTIASLSMTGVVTLLCYETNDTFCHRRFVKNIVETMLVEYQNNYERIWLGSAVDAIDSARKRYDAKIREVEANKAKKDSGA